MASASCFHSSSGSIFNSFIAVSFIAVSFIAVSFIDIPLTTGSMAWHSEARLRPWHEAAKSPQEALDRMWWLLGLLGGILSLERFTELQRLIMLHPEMKFVPRTEFDSPPYYRGRADGEAKGKAEAVLRVLAARCLSLTEEQRQLVLACQDHVQLERWLDVAVTASSGAALFGVKP